MKKVLTIFVAVLLVTACSSDDEGNGGINLTVKGVNQTLKLSEATNVVDVKITDFRLSFRDVEFKLDESDLTGTEFEFRGPYDVDLMSETEALSQSIGSVKLPDGTYKVLRFKLHKSTDREASDVLYDRSMYMQGTIDGTPFEFWHDTSENFDIENPGGIVISRSVVNVTVQYTMDQFLNAMHTIDLSQARDEDEDGLIKINPDDDDGNGNIADNMKDNIKMAADLIKL